MAVPTATAPNGISVPRWSLSQTHLKGSRPWASLSGICRLSCSNRTVVSAMVYARSGERWTHEILIADSILSLQEIGVELPLAELYDGIVLETERDADRTPDGEPA